MLTDGELQEYKAKIEKRNQLAQEINNIIAVGAEKEKQGLEIVKSYGYSSLTDVSKMREELDTLEVAIREEGEKVERDIVEFNRIKAEKDSILIN